MGYNTQELEAIEFLKPPTIRRKNKSYLKFDKLENPIPDYVDDPEEVKKFFDRFPWIPYAGLNNKSSHYLVRKLQQMKRLSTTKGAIMNSLNTYCFGSKIQMFRGLDDDFDLGLELQELSNNEKVEYYEFIKSIDLFGSSTKGLITQLSDGLQSTGEMLLEVIMTNFEGIKKVSFQIVRSENAALKNSDEKIFGITQLWDESYIMNNPIKQIPVYPNAVQMEDGSIRTIFHFKKGEYDRGRPDDMSCFTHQYGESRLSEVIAKELNTAFMGKVLIEVGDNGTDGGFNDEEAAIYSGYDSAIDRIEKNYTNDGTDPTSIMAWTRQEGVPETKVHQIKGNADAKYIREISEQLRMSIVSANDWSEALLKKDVMSGLNTTGLKDVFTIVNATRVMNHRNEVSSFYNKALSFAAEYLENDLALNSCLKFTGPIEEILNNFNVSNNDPGDNIIDTI